jgi:hypothetical protein
MEDYMTVPPDFPGMAQLLVDLQNIIDGYRNQGEAALNLWNQMTSIGGASGLVNYSPEFTAATAAAYIAAVDYCYTVYQLFNGLASQPAAFNFANALAEWAGG